MMNRIIHRILGDEVDSPGQKARMKAGKTASWISIMLNILLSATKALIGFSAHSISIVADAINNLSDASSNLICLIGYKLADKPADHEHPYGHGRYEYVAGLAVAALILAFGFELVIGSVRRVVEPQTVTFSFAMVAVLVLSVSIKSWMGWFNTSLGKTINSQPLKTAAIDSRNDAIATTGVLACMVLDHLFDWNLDGYAGVGIGLFVCWSGIEAIRETLNPLLGTSPDPQLVEHIRLKILSYPGVLGTHDLMVHDYGPDHLFASAHAEMAAEIDPLISHDLIDNIEEDFKNQDHILLVLHYDPIITNDSTTNDLRSWISRNVKTINPELSIHDLRVVPGPTHTNVIFDCLRPAGLDMSNEELKGRIEHMVVEHMPDAVCKITIDDSYVSAS